MSTTTNTAALVTPKPKNPKKVRKKSASGTVAAPISSNDSKKVVAALEQVADAIVSRDSEIKDKHKIDPGAQPADYEDKRQKAAEKAAELARDARDKAIKEAQKAAKNDDSGSDS